MKCFHIHAHVEAPHVNFAISTRGSKPGIDHPRGKPVGIPVASASPCC